MDPESLKHVPGEFRVIRLDMPEFVGDWRAADYGDPYAPRTAALRVEFGIEGVVAGQPDEFSAIRALKRWVRSRWDHGWSPCFNEVSDALDLLNFAARGEQFTCGFYAKLFVECCTALGWPARPVGCSLEDCEFPRDYRAGNVGHAVAEVWSNDLRKWVLIDADANAHYEDGGVPMSALEIRAAWFDRRVDCVEMVEEEPRFLLPREPTLRVLRELDPLYAHHTEESMRLTFERFTRHKVMDYYARLMIGGREWVDDHCLPTFIHHYGPSGGLQWTSNRAAMYPSLNSVRFTATPSWEPDRTAKLALALEHCMPFFSHFEARVDGGGWVRCEATHEWPMHEGANVLECRAVSAMGRAGIVSRLEVAYARPQGVFR